jgi:hypothetical protein
VALKYPSELRCSLQFAFTNTPQVFRSRVSEPPLPVFLGSRCCRKADYSLGTSTNTLQERDITLMATHLKLWCTLFSLRTWISDIGKIRGDVSRAISPPLLDVLMPKLAAVVTRKILSCRKTEPHSSWSTLYNRIVLVSLSELSTVSTDEAPQASEGFLAIYLSLSHANRGLVRRLNELPELPLTQCRVERVGRQFHAVPVLTCPRIWNCLDQDIRVLLGDGHKLSGPGFDGSAVPDVPAKRSRRSEYPFHLPAVCLPAAAGTMKVTQKHTTSSLHLFLNRQDVWCTDISASLEICRFISSVCTKE